MFRGALAWQDPLMRRSSTPVTPEEAEAGRREGFPGGAVDVTGKPLPKEHKKNTHTQPGARNTSPPKYETHMFQYNKSSYVYFLDKVSATMLSVPFLCLITSFRSCTIKAHRMSRWL